MSSIQRTQRWWRAATFLFIAGAAAGFVFTIKTIIPVQAALTDRVRGMILLQVEQHGEAWYIEPVSLHRFFLGRPDDAFSIMRQQGLGITDANLAKIPESGSTDQGDWDLRRRLSGRILLQVEQHGEAWYIYPPTLQRHFLGRPADAFNLMTDLGLGITDYNLYQIISEQNLDVPFTSQAPYGVWDFDHDNFCEEASVLMAARYALGQGINGAADADRELYRLKDWEVANLGHHKDTNAEETLQMLTANFAVDGEIVVDPTAAYIRQAIVNGQSVIVPVAGRMLGNTHFRGLGPLYHVFVIRGYTNDGWFIVNEPGTSYGRNYRYRQETVMNAIHDFNGGQVLSGQRVVIVVSAR